MNKLVWLKQNLDELKNQDLFNNIRTVESPMGPKIKVNGKWVLNFSANNYLGLANDLRLKKAVKKAVQKYGVGPGAVRSIAGTTTLHLELEEKLAKFKKAEGVITFQSGFNANIATIPALVGEGDIVFSDELNHASIIDACRLTKAEVIRYQHLNLNDLDEKLHRFLANQSFKGRALIVTDGVFSMDGDIAPLPGIAKIANKYSALLMVDDAHGEGVLGKKGRGIVDHYKLHGKVDIEIGTLSKAFGVVGGFVAGKKEIIDWLRQRSRPFLFSSAMTIADTSACIEAVKILQNSEALVKKLWDNTKYFKKMMSDMGFDLGGTETPIVPIMLGDATLAKKYSAKLFEVGIFAVSIVYPTVPLGKARIRVMLSASHSKNDLDKAVSIFAHIGRSLKVIS